MLLRTKTALKLTSIRNTACIPRHYIFQHQRNAVVESTFGQKQKNKTKALNKQKFQPKTASSSTLTVKLWRERMGRVRVGSDSPTIK